MSTASQIAAREAAFAEAELTEAESTRIAELVEEGAAPEDALLQVVAEREEEHDADDGPPPPIPESGEPTREQLQKLDAENLRHIKAVRRVMGAFVDGFEECDHCNTLALVPPGPRPQTHEFFIRCETCQGFGQVLTGSTRPGNEERDCPTCGGRGYVEALGPAGQPLAEVPLAQQEATAGLVAAAGADQPSTPPRPAPAPTYGNPSWMGDPAVGPRG